MSFYSECTSGLIQRGEEIFPPRFLSVFILSDEILALLNKIPRAAERYLTADEILNFYE
jgi:hypothetical protein